MSNDGPIRYDIFNHKTGVRVVEVKTGRRGIVYRIDETAPEWIQPLILWDFEPGNSSEMSYAKGPLVLEDV